MAVEIKTTRASETVKQKQKLKKLYDLKQGLGKMFYGVNFSS